MYDTRTPADLGYRPSPTRAERDTWRTPALTVRPLRIAAGVRDAVTAAYTHPMPAVTFTDRNGVTWQDVVICAQCSFTSTDLNLNRCPGDGAVLGETSRQV